MGGGMLWGEYGRRRFGVVPSGALLGGIAAYAFAAPAPVGGNPATGPQGAPHATFRGHRPGEHVILSTRPHLLYALFVSWRLVLYLLVIAALIVGVAQVGLVLPPLVVVLLLGVLLVVPGLLLAVRMLNNWGFRHYILTDWRVMDVVGYTYRHRKQLVLGQVQQVIVERPNIFAAWLDIGTVVVQSAGNQNWLRLEWVAHPSAVSHQIQRQQLAAGSAGPAGPVAPAADELRHPVARAAWARVEQVEEDLAKAADIPSDTPAIRVSFELLTENDERVLESISRHWTALVRAELMPVCALVGSVVVTLALLALGLGDSALLLVLLAFVGILAAGGWAVLRYLNYADDALILTTLRVVDLDRVLYVVAENRRQAMYDKIQNVRVDTPFWGRVFGYGSIVIETAGRDDDIKMACIPNAAAVQDRIFLYMNAEAARKDAAGRRSRRREAKRWMATLLNEMLVEVPDVLGLALLDAAQRLHAAGLAMVIEAERTEPSVRPGTVIAQAPLAGTSALRGSEARVTLSRQATATHPQP